MIKWVNLNLCNNGGYCVKDTSAKQLSTDLILKVVSNVALAHSTADCHRRNCKILMCIAKFGHSHVNHTNLRTIAVCDNNLIF